MAPSPGCPIARRPFLAGGGRDQAIGVREAAAIGVGIARNNRVPHDLAETGDREPRSRIGWETIPSSAPAYDALPKAE